MHISKGNGAPAKRTRAAERPLLDWEFDITTLKDEVKALKSDALRPSAEAFVANLEGVESIMMMPLKIAATGGKWLYWAIEYIGAITDPITRFFEGGMANPGILAELRNEKARFAQAEASFKKFLEEKGGREKIKSYVESSLEELMHDAEFSSSVRVLLLSSTTLLWTAFECLAKDVWTAAVNSGQIAIAYRALRSIPEDAPQEGISRKQIEVGFLARFGFDLRHQLGTILSAKFKFSDLAGIKNAYSCAFEKAPSIAEVFDRLELRQLEATRHLIVHSAGKVDDKFKKEMSSPQKVGEFVQLDAKVFSGFATAVTESGSRLFSLVDEWLVLNSTEASQSEPT